MRKTLGILALLVAPSLASAQAAAPAVPMPKNVISIQPLAAMFTVLAAEYERKGGTSWTWGVGITNVGLDDDASTAEASYNSADLKFRYYPQGVALQGFSFGASIGGTKVTNKDDSTVPPIDESASAGSFGVLLEYQWLLGARKKFAVALGVGAKMLTVDEDEFSNDDIIVRYPTARISVGYAF
jgi:hypothetical protein